MDTEDRKMVEDYPRGRGRRGQRSRGRGRGRGRIARGQIGQDRATHLAFQNGSRAENHVERRAREGVRAGGKTLDGALTMLVSRYGNLPVAVERYDDYILDATEYTLLLQEIWASIAIYDPGFLHTHSSASFYYGCYLMLLKRVATVRAGTVGSNSVITKILRDIPDYPIPQAIGLYLDGVGTVKMEDGTIVVPDLVLFGDFANEDSNEFGKIVRLSHPDEPDRMDLIEKVFPLYAVYAYIRNQVQPGFSPADTFPDMSGNAGNFFNYAAFRHCFSFPDLFSGNHGFQPDDIFDIFSDPPTHMSYVFWTISLSEKIRDVMFSIKVYTPIVTLPVSLVGDISQLAITVYSDSGQQAMFGHFRKSSGFSLHAARVFSYRRGRPPSQVINAGHAQNFADDYIKIRPPAPRMLFEIDNRARVRRAYVNAFFLFREPV